MLWASISRRNIRQNRFNKRAIFPLGEFRGEIFEYYAPAQGAVRVHRPDRPTRHGAALRGGFLLQRRPGTRPHRPYRILHRPGRTTEKITADVHGGNGQARRKRAFRRQHTPAFRPARRQPPATGNRKRYAAIRKEGKHTEDTALRPELSGYAAVISAGLSAPRHWPPPPPRGRRSRAVRSWSP